MSGSDDEGSHRARPPWGTISLIGVDDFATHTMPLDQAPQSYETFQEKRDGAVRVLLKP